MPESFLYDVLTERPAWAFSKEKSLNSIAQNLNPQYELRPYQVEAFCALHLLLPNPLPGQVYPLHFLFNMATGAARRSSWLLDSLPL